MTFLQLKEKLGACGRSHMLLAYSKDYYKQAHKKKVKAMKNPVLYYTYPTIDKKWTYKEYLQLIYEQYCVWGRPPSYDINSSACYYRVYNTHYDPPTFNPDPDPKEPKKEPKEIENACAIGLIIPQEMEEYLNGDGRGLEGWNSKAINEIITYDKFREWGDDCGLSLFSNLKTTRSLLTIQMWHDDWDSNGEDGLRSYMAIIKLFLIAIRWGVEIDPSPLIPWHEELWKLCQREYDFENPNGKIEEEIITQWEKMGR